MCVCVNSCVVCVFVRCVCVMWTVPALKKYFHVRAPFTAHVPGRRLLAVRCSACGLRELAEFPRFLVEESPIRSSVVRVLLQPVPRRQAKYGLSRCNAGAMQWESLFPHSKSGQGPDPRFKRAGGTGFRASGTGFRASGTGIKAGGTGIRASGTGIWPKVGLN